uniref:hypothetical protein n=2 Tax=Bacteria TaxID=2 RepID=UPI0006D11B5D
MEESQGLVFYLQYELRLADQRVQQIKMVADHPLLSSAGTDNEAQGEVTERTDSRFPLRHYSQQKRVSRVNAAVYDRP